MSEQTVRIQIGRYDFLGLFIPSLIVVSSSIAIGLARHGKDVSWLAGLLKKDTAYQLAFFLIIFIVIIYIVGHIIDGLSIYFYECVLVKKLHGYPFERLLKLPSMNGAERKMGANHYRNLAFSTVLLVLAFTFDRYYQTWMSVVLFWVAALLLGIGITWKIFRSFGFMRRIFPATFQDEATFFSRRLRIEQTMFEIWPTGWSAKCYSIAENLVRHMLNLHRPM